MRTKTEMQATEKHGLLLSVILMSAPRHALFRNVYASNGVVQSRFPDPKCLAVSSFDSAAVRHMANIFFSRTFILSAVVEEQTCRVRSRETCDWLFALEICVSLHPQSVTNTVLQSSMKHGGGTWAVRAMH